MTLNQLRYLLAIVDADLNITVAARRVHATQPGLSKQLKQLEDELGSPLIIRRGKSLESLTSLGQQVVESARRIVGEADSIRTLADNQMEVPRGRLRIATTHTQARYVLQHLLPAFRLKYPEVSVHIEPGDPTQFAERLRRDEIDLAIQSTVEAPPSSVFALPAYRWDRVVVVPEGHPLASFGRHIELADLAEYSLTSYDSSRRPESSLQRVFRGAGLTPKIVVTALDADLVKTYARTGLGIGIFAEMALQPEDAGSLVALDAEHLFPPCTAWICLAEQRPPRAYVDDFIQLLAPHLPAQARDARATRADAIPQWRHLHKRLRELIRVQSDAVA